MLTTTPTATLAARTHQRRVRLARLMAGVALASASLTACSSGPGGEATCTEYLDAESADATLMEPLSDEQEAMIKNMLDEHGKDTGTFSTNVESAAIQLISFCGADDSGNPSHPDDPIEDGVNLD